MGLVSKAESCTFHPSKGDCFTHEARHKVLNILHWILIHFKIPNYLNTVLHIRRSDCWGNLVSAYNIHVDICAPYLRAATIPPSHSQPPGNRSSIHEHGDSTPPGWIRNPAVPFWLSWWAFAYWRRPEAQINSTVVAPLVSWTVVMQTAYRFIMPFWHTTGKQVGGLRDMKGHRAPAPPAQEMQTF